MHILYMKNTQPKTLAFFCALFSLYLFASAPLEKSAADQREQNKKIFQTDPADRSRYRQPGLQLPEKSAKSLTRDQAVVNPLEEPLYTVLPYEPASFSIDPGMTGMVALMYLSGIHLINPRHQTISDIKLNEPHREVVIDPETPDIKAWMGPLGNDSGPLLDVAMTRNGQTALVSNFGDATVYIVSLRSGSPEVLAGVPIDMFAEDIAIDPSDQWALVTDGGQSSGVAVIHIPTRTWRTFHHDDDDDPSTPSENDDSYPLKPDEPGSWILPDGGDAQAVAIARDGRTVLLVDYLGGKVHVVLLDPISGELSLQQSVTLTRYGTDPSDPTPWIYWPVNVTISPDGRTALVATTFPSNDVTVDEGGNLAVLYIDQPGHVRRKPDVVFPYYQDTEIGTTGGQSVAFSRDGKKAYYVTASKFRAIPSDPDDTDPYSSLVIEELIVNSPGQVSRGRALRLPTVRGTGQFFGIETIATSPDGNHLYVTNPSGLPMSPVIDVVSVRGMYLAKRIGTATNYPDPDLDDDDPPDESDIIEALYPTGIAFPEAPINLGVSLDTGEGKAPVDEEFTFDVILENPSLGHAFRIEIGSSLPDGLDIVSASADIGSWDAVEKLWTIDRLDRGTQAVLTVTAIASSLGNKPLAFFIDSQVGYDPVGSNNRAEAVIRILGKADLSISGESSSATPIVSTSFTVSLTAANSGPLNAGKAFVNQPLPNGWSVLGSSGDGMYDSATGLWTIGALPVGSSATVQLTLQSSTLGGTILTFPVNDSETFDPDERNNRLNLAIQIVTVAPPLEVGLQRLENDLIFTKELLNRISWQHNPVNSTVTGYRIFSKIKGSSSAYTLLTTTSASANEYAHRNLQNGTLYSYRISAINANGDESPAVIVEN